MKHFYTSGEARQYLDMDVGAFYYLIETGKIKRITPPGKKRGFYSKHQIERLANERLNYVLDEEEARPIFMKATWDDLDEEYELATLLLNGNAPALPLNFFNTQHNQAMDKRRNQRMGNWC